MFAESENKSPNSIETITLGGGCYWCTEAVYQQLKGVLTVTSGYMGGDLKNPTYRQVCRGNTGHAEVIQIRYDSKIISTAEILQWFWKAHDPTTLNRQGNDVGTQYRSVIFYHSEAQRKLAKDSLQRVQANFSNPIVTEITAASTFYPAEVEMQNYYNENKNRNPYCSIVIRPKLKKLGLERSVDRATK